MSSRKRWKVEKASTSPSFSDIAWATGIIEGEGCIWGGSSKSATEISVVQKEPWLTRILQRLFGGALGQIHKQGYHRVNSYCQYGLCVVQQEPL